MRFKTPSSIIALAVAAVLGCVGATRAVDDDRVRSSGPFSVVYRGPELEASVGFRHAAADVGDRWLILVVQLTAPPKSANITVNRGDITIRTPDGRRVRLLTQPEFREVFGEINLRVRRAISNTPPVLALGANQRRCNRWFLAEPRIGVGRDQMPITSFEICSGPLVFRIPGNVQPGRWRLVIELPESTADIPFEIEIEG